MVFMAIQCFRADLSRQWATLYPDSYTESYTPQSCSQQAALPPQICLDWLRHSTAMFCIPLAELDSGSNALPPDAPICDCPGGTTSRGSQKNSDSSARQRGQGKIKATSQEAQVTFSSFRIRRIKCTVKTADCEVQVSGKPSGIYPSSHQQLGIKRLLYARLDTA